MATQNHNTPSGVHDTALPEDPCPVAILRDDLVHLINAVHQFDVVTSRLRGSTLEATLAERAGREAWRVKERLIARLTDMRATSAEGALIQIALAWSEADTLASFTGESKGAKLAHGAIERLLYAIRDYVELSSGKIMPAPIDEYFMPHNLDTAAMVRNGPSGPGAKDAA